ncbi:MAG: peptidase M19 [Chloroflexota bacterium]|nr:MAG: peptidase M19 [Chloroflexota bacterium]
MRLLTCFIFIPIPTMTLIVDAHQDLAWNMVTFGRDYSLAAHETRQREVGGSAPKINGQTLLGWPDYQKGKVAIVFSTLFVAPIKAARGQWDVQYYATPDQAHQKYLDQVDAYYRLCDEHPEKFRLILNKSDMEIVLKSWEGNASAPLVGLVILMEGAEGVRSPGELALWQKKGVRLIGPAWAGTRFCGGTGEPGGLTPEGYELLDGMADFNITLDISHMDERAALEALDYYPGSIVASHANAKALLKNSSSNRHLTDRVIQGLMERDAIIGVVPHNRFLKDGWNFSDSRSEVTLAEHVVAQIDHICQIAGNAKHVGIGSDFDGGFGLSGVPAEIDTIADLQKLGPILAQKGYTEEDVKAILGGNWIAYLKETLP